VVDDRPENLALMGELLRPHFRVRVASSGARALRAMATLPHPDLVLLDIMMPEMDGYEVLRRLRADPTLRHIPVIFVTAMGADEDEAHGLELGAVDYIAKPVRPAILLARLRNHLELKRHRDRLTDQNGFLEAEIARRMRENELIKDVSLHALAMLAEARDNETGNHLHRTRAYVEILARKLSQSPRYASALDEAHIRMIGRAAPLHDIGKVGIPDDILHKPGRLDVAEFTVMKTHAAIGGDAIANAMARVREDANLESSLRVGATTLEFLETARQIAQFHHEKWDGSGYPAGLAGEDIPLPARLMALADVYDALSCRRVYKPAFALEEVERILSEGRGRHFDPDIVDAYFASRDEFLDIARRYAEPTLEQAA